MALITIETTAEQLQSGARPLEEEARRYCRQLEAGDILYIPGMPFEIPAADLDFVYDARRANQLPAPPMPSHLRPAWLRKDL